MQSGSTELPEGTVHIYRHTYSPGDKTGPLACASSLGEAPNDGTMLAILAVPSYMAPSDFLTFVAPAAESMAHLRMIR